MKYIFAVLLLVLVGYTSFADTPVASPTPEIVGFTPSPEPDIFTPPGWLKDAILFVYSAPVVGPVIVEILKWLGVVASVLTTLATAFFAIVKSLSAVLRLTKLVGLAQQLDRLYVLLAPYLKFVSLYNAQREEFKKK